MSLTRDMKRMLRWSRYLRATGYPRHVGSWPHGAHRALARVIMRDCYSAARYVLRRDTGYLG